MQQKLGMTLAIAIAFAASGASAHNADEHLKNAASAKFGPDCSKVQDMDESKIDPNDAVTQAVMRRCAGQNKAHADTHGADRADAPKTASPHADDHGDHQ